MKAFNKIAVPGNKVKTNWFYIWVAILLTLIGTASIVFGVRTLLGGEEVSSGVLVNGIREFRISERQWSFSPAVIRVNPGEQVRFIVKSEDLSHGFTINELGVNLALSPNQSAVTETIVPADLPDNIYAMYCSVFCGLGHPYMKGEIIVGNPKLFLGIGTSKILPFAGTAVLAILVVGIVLIRERKKSEND